MTAFSRKGKTRSSGVERNLRKVAQFENAKAKQKRKLFMNSKGQGLGVTSV